MCPPLLSDNIPIHIAIQNGNVEVLKWLLQTETNHSEWELEPERRNLERKNHLQDTPIQTAIKEGNLECFKILENHRADTNAQDREGRNLLLLAFHSKKATETIQFLLANNFPQIPDKENKTVLHYLSKLFPNLIETNFNPWYLKRYLNQPDNNGRTPIYDICDSQAFKSEMERFEVFNFLSRQGVNFDLPLPLDKNSCLHLACQNNNRQIIDELKHFQKFRARNILGKTPLHIVCENKNESLLHILYPFYKDGERSVPDAMTCALESNNETSIREMAKLYFLPGNHHNQEDLKTFLPLGSGTFGIVHEVKKIL